MKNTVLPLAKETGWLEDISAEGLELTRAEEERETFNEGKMADNSYINSERGEFSFETLTIASTMSQVLIRGQDMQDERARNEKDFTTNITKEDNSNQRQYHSG